MSTNLRRAALQTRKYSPGSEFGSRFSSPPYHGTPDHGRAIPIKNMPFQNNDERPRLLEIVSAYSRLVRLHTRLVAGIVLVMTAIAALGVTRLADKYTATTLLVLDQQSTRLLDPKAPPSLNPDGEVEILKSDSVALKTLDKLSSALPPELSPQPGRLARLIAPITGAISDQVDGIKSLFGLNSQSSDAEVDPSLSNAALSQIDSGTDAALAGPIPPAKASSLQALKQRVTIRRRGLTDVIAIEVDAADPVRAAQIANAYAAAYLDVQVQTKVRAIERAEALLSRQLSSLDDELKRSGPQIGLRQVYQDTQNRLKAVAQQRDTVSPDARVVSVALPPRGAKFPGARLLGAVAMMISIAASFAFAVGVAYLRENRPRVVQSENDLERVVGVRALASVPVDERLRNNRRLDGIASWSPAYTDAMRRIYLHLQTEDRGSKSGAVLVTSTGYTEGKTTLALSLARFAASSGARVAIIDGDLDRPGLHLALGLECGPSLIDLVKDPIDYKSIFQTDPLSGCAVISAGHLGATSSERAIASEMLPDLLRRLEGEFDLVIVDAPPAELVSETPAFLSSATTALYVIKAGEANLADVQSNLRDLHRASDTKIFAVISYA